MDSLRAAAIAAIASDDRRHYQGDYSGPPADLIHETVARLGLRVSYEDLGSRYGELDLYRGVIWINSTLFAQLHPNTDPVAVEHFTIAHELGHNSLHSWRLRQGLPLSAVHEREADVYAGAFLMPAENIQASREWSQLQERFSWAPIYRLAKRFRVSPSAVERRLRELQGASGTNVIPLPRRREFVSSMKSIPDRITGTALGDM